MVHGDDEGRVGVVVTAGSGVAILEVVGSCGKADKVSRDSMAALIVTQWIH